MTYNNQQPKDTDGALIVAIISAFRSITPSQTKASIWYTKQNTIPSPLSRSLKSKYYAPIFGSMFASALAFIMILTSYSNPPQTEMALRETNDSSDFKVASFSSQETTVTSETTTKDRQILAKIDAQSKATSRTQADESFTESLNVETSLQDLFE